MYTVENHIGKLFEVRIVTPMTEEELGHFVQDLNRVLGKIPGKYVGVTDLTEAHIFPPYVTQTMIQYMSASSPRVIRSAMLIGEGATFALQIERVLRSSNSDLRRAFRRAEELETWVGEVLTIEERGDLAQALDAA